MSADPSFESSQYRVTLFFGPEQVQGKPCTHACVFNVKKRSWKGGVQVAVEITDAQIESSRATTDFNRWIAEALIEVPTEERAAQTERAGELFVQAVCRCRLDQLLQFGITQENQCLSPDTGTAEWKETVSRRIDFITSYVSTELDLLPRDTTRS
ncbi:MAG: hypothetical protein GDA67_07920 [Nitrospira sp. CR1.3]|nr:hypothetical protein [Nitrospira sp. CR1.3]